MKLSYDELREHVDSGRLQPVYVVTGNQDLLRDLASESIQRAALHGEPNPFNFDRFDGEECSGADVVMSANLLPMLGGRRMVLVKRAQKLLEKSEELRSHLEDPSPRTVLILVLSKSPDRRKKSWKEIEKTTTVVTCDAPRPAELEDWVFDQAAARDLGLGRDAVRYLVSEFGSDLRRLLNELEKLSLYSGGDRLDLETIATVLGRGKAQNIFKFIDAIGSGDSAKALRQLGRLLEEGEPPLKILALVDRLVGQLQIAKEMSSRHGGQSLAQVLGVPPYAARSVAEAARRFDDAGLRRALIDLAETDRVLKSSGLPSRLLLERLTIALCAQGGTSVSSPRERRAGG